MIVSPTLDLVAHPPVSNIPVYHAYLLAAYMFRFTACSISYGMAKDMDRRCQGLGLGYVVSHLVVNNVILRYVDAAMF